MRILRSAAAVAALLVFAGAASAAGLGRLTVNSALGQILNAEIDLVSLQPGEADTLNVRVAPPEAFQDARIEYSGSLRLLRFAVEKRANGSSFLKVTSVGPINEPFLDVLIEMSWPSGRIQREYPILLDPPGYAQGRVAPSVAAAPAPRIAETPPAATPAAPSSTPSAPETATVTPSAPSASAEMPTGVVSEPTSDTYGPIEKGETLSKIAGQVKPSNVSLEQMLVALYRENKSAFIGNNMNRMRTGQILKVPAADDVAQIEQKDARAEIRTQVADWKSYRENLAGGVASLTPREDSSTASSGRIGSAAVTPPAPPSAAGSDVLKLSKSDAKAAAGSAGSKGGVSQDRFNAMQEELIAKDKALKEAQSRVADLEKQIRDMQRLIEMKAGVPSKGDAAKLAEAQKQAEAAKAEAAKAEAAKAEAAKAEAAKAEAAKAEAAKAELAKADAAKAAAAKASEAAKTEAAKTEAAKITETPKVAEAPKAAPKTAEAKPAPKAAPKKGAPPPEKSFVDEMMDNPAYLALGGAVVLGAIIGGFLFVRRRKARAEAGPSSSMTSAFPSDLKPATGTGKAGGGLVDTGNSSFLTDFDKTGPGTIDTDEVDPVAEAEVYIAYGRDAQAEEILKEAMARDKNRPEIMLKLLEIYHARKSGTAFEQVAKELHASVGDSSPLWQKAAAMGAQIDPQNPLYAGAGSSTATFQAMAPAKPDVDFDLAGSSAAAAAPAPSFDLDLDKSSSAPTESAIDFEMSQKPTPTDVSAEQHEEKPSFDFDLSGLDSGTPKAAEPAPASGASSSGMSLDLADLSLDSPGGGGGGGGGSAEAVGTKLELAKAYLEIGDKDGARDILQEVAKEGSAAQQEEAKKLIASL